MATKGYTIPLIEREISDGNFAHTLRLLGPCAAWAETVRVGKKIEHNDLNMIAIPVEIALAFSKKFAADDDEIGAAAREAIALLDQFRAISGDLGLSKGGEK